MEKIRILLADDHTIVRQGIHALLSDEVDMVVVGEAEDGRTAVKLAAELKPNVVVMDISMPLLNGLEATCQIKAQNPNTKVLILSMHDNDEYIRGALARGASGYILKDAAARELTDAIRAVQRGEAVLSPVITRLVIEDYLRFGDLAADQDNDGLSPREREVLQLIAEGHTNKEIAGQLGLSVKTIEAHRTRIMDKLKIHNIAGLTRYAISRGIITAE